MTVSQGAKDRGRANTSGTPYVRNNARARADVNGRGSTSRATHGDSQHTACLRSVDTASRRSLATKVSYGAATAGTRTGAAKVGIEMPRSVDTCGSQKQSRI